MCFASTIGALPTVLAECRVESSGVDTTHIVNLAGGTSALMVVAHAAVPVLCIGDDLARTDIEVLRPG